jgi:3-oxoacyl-[acyl-carrier protein] reductase
MLKLDNKSIIITGSSKGIGKEIAIECAKNGALVTVNYHSSKESAEEVVSQIKANGGKAIAVRADVSKKQDVEYLFKQAISTYGKVDVLVNNAGLMINKSISKFTDDDFNNIFNINVKGVLHGLQTADKYLEDNGKIVNFSSSTVKMMLPSYGLYSASKAAVNQLTRIYSKEVGRGISVNSIAPGGTETELFLKDKSEELIENLKSRSAFNRIAQPNDIASIVLFLASDDSKWISGQVIYANGAAV